MPPYEVSIATPFDIKKIISLQGISRSPLRRSPIPMIEHPVPGMSNQVMISYSTVIAGYPNRSFMSAIDITTIKETTMLMDRRVCAENQAMLDDEEAFMALSAKLIADLIDKEPDTGRLPDVKVRFR